MAPLVVVVKPLACTVASLFVVFGRLSAAICILRDSTVNKKVTWFEVRWWFPVASKEIIPANQLINNRGFELSFVAN